MWRAVWPQQRHTGQAGLTAGPSRVPGAAAGVRNFRSAHPAVPLLLGVLVVFLFGAILFVAAGEARAQGLPAGAPMTAAVADPAADQYASDASSSATPDASATLETAATPEASASSDASATPDASVEQELLRPPSTEPGASVDSTTQDQPDADPPILDPGPAEPSREAAIDKAPAKAPAKVAPEQPTASASAPSSASSFASATASAAVTEPGPPPRRGVAGTQTSGLGRAVDDLFIPEWVGGGLFERIEKMGRGLPGQAMDFAAGLVGGLASVNPADRDATAPPSDRDGKAPSTDAPSPANNGSLPPPPGPAAPPPPPPAPLAPAGGLSFSGGSPSGGSNNSSNGELDVPIQLQFAVLDPFSFALWQGGGRTWLSREPVRPGSAPRPPNDRPG